MKNGHVQCMFDDGNISCGNGFGNAESNFVFRSRPKARAVQSGHPAD